MADINLVIHRIRPFIGLAMLIGGVVLLFRDFFWTGIALVLIAQGVGGRQLSRWIPSDND